MERQTLFATCPKGLEYLLRDELHLLGAGDAREALAGVHFGGTLGFAYRACLWSRLASRILLRLAEFDDLFATSVRAVERHGAGVRMHLAGEPGLVDRVRDLAARETSCCSFFSFTIDGTDADLTLDISVPPAGQQILDALAARAQELSA